MTTHPVYAALFVAVTFVGLAASPRWRDEPAQLLWLTMLMAIGCLVFVEPQIALAGKDILSKNATDMKTQSSTFAAAIIIGSLVLGFGSAVLCTAIPILHRFAWNAWSGLAGLIVIYIIATWFSDTVRAGLAAFYVDPLGFFLGGAGGA